MARAGCAPLQSVVIQVASVAVMIVGGVLTPAPATTPAVPSTQVAATTTPPSPTATPTPTPSATKGTPRPTASPTPTPTPSGPLPSVNAILFPGSSAKLPASAVPEVERLVALLRSRPDARVTLAGHTDSGRTQSVRVALGQERADAVAQALVQRGIPASRITTTSEADRLPVASNASAEGRAQNRRVSVTLSSGNG